MSKVDVRQYTGIFGGLDLQFTRMCRKQSTRTIEYGDIIGLLLSPITNVVGALQAQGGNIVGALKTIAERES